MDPAAAGQAHWRVLRRRPLRVAYFVGFFAWRQVHFPDGIIQGRHRWRYGRIVLRRLGYMRPQHGRTVNQWSIAAGRYIHSVLLN
jgi:hypothetical protein